WPIYGQFFVLTNCGLICSPSLRAPGGTRPIGLKWARFACPGWTRRNARRLEQPLLRCGKRQSKFRRTCRAHCPNWIPWESNLKTARCAGKCLRLPHNFWADRRLFGQEALLGQSLMGQKTRLPENKQAFLAKVLGGGI